MMLSPTICAVFDVIRPHWRDFTICIVMSIMSSTAIPTILSELVSGHAFMMYLIPVAFLAKLIANTIKEPIVYKLSSMTNEKYLTKQLNRYIQHDADSRNTFEASTMYQSAREIADRMGQLSDQCVYFGSYMIESLISVLVMFFIKGYIALIIVLIAIRYMWHKMVIESQLNDCKIARDVSRETTTQLQGKIQRLLPELQQRRSGVDGIIENIVASNLASYKSELSYARFWTSNDIIGQATSVILIYYFYLTDNLGDLVLLYQLVSQFNNAAAMCANLYVQLSKADTMHEKYEKRWKSLTPYKEIVNLPFPQEGLKFESIHTERDGFSLITNNVSIERDKTYLVTGESGSGKSTICSVLLGDIVGGILSSCNDPAQYRWTFAMSYQSRKFQDNNITLREIFDIGVKTSDEEIMALLQLVELGDFVDSLMNRKKSDEAEEEKYIIQINDGSIEHTNDSSIKYSLISVAIHDLATFKVIPRSTDLVDMKNPLDVKLKGLSGGQKTRIDLVRTVLRAKSPEINVVIFDEPDAGIDQMQAMRVLLKVLNSDQLAGKTKIIVTHMCECQLRHLKVDEKWKIHEGRLSIETAH